MKITETLTQSRVINLIPDLAGKIGSPLTEDTTINLDGNELSINNGSDQLLYFDIDTSATVISAINGGANAYVELHGGGSFAIAGTDDINTPISIGGSPVAGINYTASNHSFHGNLMLTDQRAGNATLVAGTVTVSNTTVTVDTLIHLTRKTAGGTIGNVTYTLNAGTDFTIDSDNAGDTSTFTYLLTELNSAI